MDSECKSSDDKEIQSLASKVKYWSQPFLQGLMFGVGHYIALKVFGPQLRNFFKSAVKPSN